MSSRFIIQLGCLFLVIFTCSVEGAVIVVGLGGTGDYETISEALVASASGDDIWVRAGRYNEAIQMKEGVALYGGFPASGTPEWEERDPAANETVIDATGLGTSTVVGADRAVLNGFTVTGGVARTGQWERSGGGVLCRDTSPTLMNCRITGNWAYHGGGLLSGGSASPTLIRCVISGNVADYYGGGLYSTSSRPLVLTNCRIEGNAASTDSGGGLARLFGGGSITMTA